MYDPHRLRRNDRRFFTRKGQIIQAKNMSAPFTIESNKVEAYKEYILKNHLIPEKQIIINFINISIYTTNEFTTVPISQFSYASNTFSLNLEAGLNTVILITELGDRYNITCYLTTFTSAYIEANQWYFIFNSNDNSAVEDVYIFLLSDATRISSTLIRNNGTQDNTRLSLFKTKYLLNLPAPSE